MASNYQTTPFEPIKDGIFQPNWELAQKALTHKEAEVQDMFNTAGVLGDVTMRYYDDFDRDFVEEIRKEYGDAADEITNKMLASKDLTELNRYKKDLNALKKKLNTDFETGRIFNIQSTHDNVKKFLEDFEKQYQDDSTMLRQKDYYLNRFIEQTQGKDRSKRDRSRDGIFQGGELLKRQDYWKEWLDSEDFKHIANKNNWDAKTISEIERAGSFSSLFKDSSYTGLPLDRLRESYFGYMMNNEDRILDYAKRRTMFGYEDDWFNLDENGNPISINWNMPQIVEESYKDAKGNIVKTGKLVLQETGKEGRIGKLFAQAANPLQVERTEEKYRPWERSAALAWDKEQRKRQIEDAYAKVFINMDSAKRLSHTEKTLALQEFDDAYLNNIMSLSGSSGSYYTGNPEVDAETYAKWLLEYAGEAADPSNENFVTYKERYFTLTDEKRESFFSAVIDGEIGNNGFIYTGNEKVDAYTYTRVMEEQARILNPNLTFEELNNYSIYQRKNFLRADDYKKQQLFALAQRNHINYTNKELLEGYEGTDMVDKATNYVIGTQKKIIKDIQTRIANNEDFGDEDPYAAMATAKNLIGQAEALNNRRTEAYTASNVFIANNVPPAQAKIMTKAYSDQVNLNLDRMNFAIISPGMQIIDSSIDNNLPGVFSTGKDKIRVLNSVSGNTVRDFRGEFYILGAEGDLHSTPTGVRDDIRTTDGHSTVDLAALPMNTVEDRVFVAFFKEGKGITSLSDEERMNLDSYYVKLRNATTSRKKEEAQNQINQARAGGKGRVYDIITQNKVEYGVDIPERTATELNKEALEKKTVLPGAQTITSPMEGFYFSY